MCIFKWRRLLDIFTRLCVYQTIHIYETISRQYGVFIVYKTSYWPIKKFKKKKNTTNKPTTTWPEAVTPSAARPYNIRAFCGFRGRIDTILSLLLQ